MTAIMPRSFTVNDYTRMRETGIFSEDDRLELLDGVIYCMSPLGPLHMALVNRFTKLLVPVLGSSALVSIQNAIRLDDLSEPQPDIAILRPDAEDYANRLPEPDDIFMLIEIADSSLAYDRDQKLPRYAQAGIPEVWLVDVGQQLIEQYTQPMQNHYTQMQKYLRGAAIQAAMLPQIRIRSNDIFK